MSTQKIYGRFEFPLGSTTIQELFQKYKENTVYNNQGIQVGGIAVARNVNENTAILMTFDEESELLLILTLTGLSGLKHNSIRLTII
jgi:hypothetical protein